MVKNIEESYKNNRKLKHDLNNHLLAIELRVKNGKQEECISILYSPLYFFITSLTFPNPIP